MKKTLLSSYISGIFDAQHGEGYLRILRYFYPEFISALLLYSLPHILDAYFISKLSSSTYATLGAANNLVHFVVKFAEALSVSTVIVAGQFNGNNQFKQAGETLRDAFWVTCITGLAIASFLYYGAYWIYYWYDVPIELIDLGVPYMKLRAISLFLLFMYMACIGFLRGIKNVRIPMLTFVAGTVFFIVFDYLLIYGKFGFPALGLNGSAVANIIQNGFMLTAVLMYILLSKTVKPYSIKLFSSLRSKEYIVRLLSLSWPVVLDKVTMAAAYVWLCKMMCPMGTIAIASFSVIKDMERFAFLPAMAFAQVITFLVSNDFGAQNWLSIKSNIKKVGFMASLMVFCILIIFSYNTQAIVELFDNDNYFANLAVPAFPLVSILVFFDLVQLILSGALRGTGNVRTVMYVRLIVVFGFFMPVSYLIVNLPIASYLLKFTLLYGSIYVGNALMSIAYINKLRGESWKKPVVQG